MVVKKNPELENYFVSVKRPLELRRHLLESSKKAVNSLQCNQKLKLLRQEKLVEIDALKDSIQELIFLNKKLTEKLPRYECLLNDVKESKPKIVSKEQAKELINPKTPKPLDKSELDRLEDALSNIELKLKSLK